MYVEFDSNTPLPIDFVKDFHRSSENKDKFYSYLVSFIYTSFVVIQLLHKNEKVIHNLDDSLVEAELSDCSQLEVDSRIILHVWNCIQMGLINVYVQTNDTDVVVLLVDYMLDF